MQKNINQESGFTLVELLIASLLLLILIAPLLSFMRAGQINRSTSIRITDVEQNARASMLSISRDISNAGYNFAPQIPLGNSSIFATVTGIAPGPTSFLTPIIPGNDINQVRTVDSMGMTRLNPTDQATMVFTDQDFNNGLPLTGSIAATGSPFISNAAFTNLYPGDFVVLSRGTQFATAIVTSVAGNTINLANGDPYGLNQVGAGPLSQLNPAPQTAAPTTLYKFFLVTYFVDGNGNLVRREHLAPPHTAIGGNNSIAPVALTPIGSGANSTYTCGGDVTQPATLVNCFVDNIIATGIEDLQFTYILADPFSTNIVGPIADPGFYGRGTNGGTPPSYRLLDIRQVNVSIKVRASERDTKIHDPYNSNQGYLYRFTLEGTFNTRNFYGSDFRPV